MSDEDYTQTATFVFPAAWPRGLSDAHCTLVYLGDINNLPDKDYLLDAAKPIAASFPHPGLVNTKKFEYFGPGREILVVTLDDSRLFAVQLALLVELYKNLGVVNASSYPTFSPHVSAGNKNSVNPFITKPSTVLLRPLELWYGEEKIKVG